MAAEGEFTAELVGADRARHIGLVDEALADDVARRSQLSVQATKDLVERMVGRTLTPDRVAAWREQVADTPGTGPGCPSERPRGNPPGSARAGV